MITISPVGLAATALTANQLSLLVGIKEKLCRSYCMGSFNPLVSVSYSYNTPTLSGNTVFIPVTAIITVISPGKCCNNTQIFAESFTVAFQDQTELPATITIASEGHTEDIGGNCRSNQLTYQDSITISLT